MIGLALGLDLLNCTAMLLWQPIPENGVLAYFWVPVFWGVSDAIIKPQLNAIYGSFFSDNQEAAFSNYSLWTTLGLTIAFSYQGYATQESCQVLESRVPFMYMIFESCVSLCLRQTLHPDCDLMSVCRDLPSVRDFRQ